MENDKDYSLDRSVEVEKIIDFYKDIEDDADNKPETEEKPKNKYTEKILNAFNSVISHIKTTALYRYFSKNSDSESNSDIETHSFGLSETGRMAIYHLISLTVCILIIVLSVILTIFLPGNKLKINEKAEELRANEEYSSLESRHTAMKTEIDELIISNQEKELLLNQITDAENTKSDLRLKIDEKKNELNLLNTQITEKRNTVAELDRQISAKTPAEKIYTPGKYTVGTHIAAGKYLVTGTGKFMIANSVGKSKINVTLNSTPLEITLDDNDVLKFDSKVKFASVY